MLRRPIKAGERIKRFGVISSSAKTAGRSKAREIHLANELAIEPVL